MYLQTLLVLGIGLLLLQTNDAIGQSRNDAKPIAVAGKNKLEPAPKSPVQPHKAKDNASSKAVKQDSNSLFMGNTIVIMPFVESIAPAAPHEFEDLRRAVVYHYGQMPREIPQWFTDLDQNRDGQIGLYEWKRAHLPVSLFERLDLNADGLITPEEILRHLAHVGPEDLRIEPRFDDVSSARLDILDDDEPLDDEDSDILRP